MSTPSPWEKFLSAATAFGATIHADSWSGSRVKYDITCVNGHQTSVRPDKVTSGRWNCTACKDSGLLLAFRKEIERRGGVLLDDSWKGSMAKYEVECRNGHKCSPTPANTVSGGWGFCGVCAKKDPSEAWQRFLSRLDELGGFISDETYRASTDRVAVTCAEGHRWTIRPASLLRGDRCGACRGLDPEINLRNFRSFVEAQGGDLLETQWLGAANRHNVRCEKGHASLPTPNEARRTGSICRSCAGRCPDAAWANFLSRVGELEGEVLEEDWLGSATPHRIRCVEGHQVSVRPNAVQQGGGICHKCAGGHWDAFYIVENETTANVKFGITSGNPRPRLSRHRARGFQRRVLVTTQLPDGLAAATERYVIKTLRDARHLPVEGRETFTVSSLSLIITTVRDQLGDAGYPWHSLPASGHSG